MATEVTQLVDEYKAWANKQVENVQALPQKVDELKTTCQNLQPAVTEYVNSITGDLQRFTQEMSPAGEDAGLYKNLLENYLWASVCLLAASIVTSVVGGVAGTILGFFMTSGAAAGLAIAVIPYLAITYLPTSEGSEEDRRLNLLLAVVVDSLVMGLALAGGNLQFYPPPVFMLAAGIGLLAAAAGPGMGGQPRTALLGAIVGGPCAALLAYGMLMGSLNGVYFMWVALIATIAAIDVQVKIGRFKEGQTATVVHQATSAFALLLAGSLMRYLFSVSSDDSAQTVN